MRINKKLLALLLSLSVIFTSFGVMAETPVTEVAVKPPVMIDSAEYDILQALDFIGEDIKLLNGDSAFTRAQFIGTLFKVAGFADVEYKPEDLTFADVTETTLYKDAIQYFYNAGYVNGTSAYEFSPNNPVTYQQAAKIIVDLLGYKDFAISRYGNDMNAFVSMAQRLDLNHNMVVGSISAPLTAQNAIIMLYNAGRAKVFEPSYYDTDGTVSYNDWNGKELFVKNSSVYYGVGTMKSNGLVSILSADVNNEIAIIDNTKYFLSDVDLTGLVGCKVEFHYKEEGGRKTLLWAGLKKNSNSMLELKAKDLAVNDSRYQGNTIVYRDGKNKKVVKLDPQYDLIYNNALYNGLASVLKPEMGNMRLIDTNFDDYYDLVVIEEYQNIVANGFSNAGQFISDKYNHSLKLEDYDNVKIYKDGQEFPAEEIGIGTVLTIVEAKNKSNLIVYVNDEIYQATLQSTWEEDGKYFYEFDGVTTQLAPSYVNIDAGVYAKIDLVLGRMYTISLDKEGNIAEIASMSDGRLEYAYLVDAWKSTDVLDDDNTYKFKLLHQNGSMLKVKSYKKVSFIHYPSGAKVTDKITGVQLYNNLCEEGVIKKQLVRITLNADGDLVELEKAKDNTAITNTQPYDNEDFSYDHSACKNYDEGSYMFNSRYYIGPQTLFFVEYDGIDAEEPYTVVKRGSFRKVRELASNGTLSGDSQFEIYDADEFLVPKAIVAKQNLGSYNQMYVLLVDSIKYKKVDGEFLKTICGYYGAAYVEMTEYAEGIIGNEIKRGDILHVGQNNNRITTYTKYCNLLEDDGYMYNKPTSNPFLLYGSPYAVGNNELFTMLVPQNNLYMSAGEDPDTYDSVVSTYGSILPIRIKSAKIAVLVYDTVNNTMFETTFQDVEQYASPGKNGSIIPTEYANENSVKFFVNVYERYVTDIIIVLK